MIFATRKAFICVGVLASMALWAIEVPTILYYANAGVIPVVKLLLLLAAVISIFVGGLRVLLGEQGRTAFILYLCFATLALWAIQFLFLTAFLVGAIVSAVALIWPYSAQQGAQTDGPTSGGSAA